MSNTQPDQPLKREALKLKEIINHCRGAPLTDWPPDEEIWVRRSQDLKRGIVIDDATVGGKINGEVWRHSFIRLTDLWAFAMARPDRSHWDWLIEFCKSWAIALGVKLPVTHLKAATQDKYQRWFDRAQEKKTDELKGHPTQLARIVAKTEKGVRGASAENIVRRLSEHYPGWAD